MLGVGKWRRSDNWCDGNVWFVSRNNVSDALYTLITTYSPPPHTRHLQWISYYTILHLSAFICKHFMTSACSMQSQTQLLWKREHWKPIIPASSFGAEWWCQPQVFSSNLRVSEGWGCPCHNIFTSLSNNCVRNIQKHLPVTLWISDTVLNEYFPTNYYSFLHWDIIFY